MKGLSAYLRGYWRETVLAPLFKLLEATLELFVPLVMAAIVDTGIASGDRNYILGMGGVLVLLGAVGLGFSITAQYFAAKAAVGFSTALRHALFGHIQSLSFSELDTVGTSTLITRMTSDMNQVQSGLNLFLRLFLRSPFIVVGAVVMAFTIDVPAALVFVVAVPLLSLVIFAVMRATIPLYQKVQGRLDRVLGLTRENLTGVRVLRAFGKEEEEVARFDGENEGLTRLQLFTGRLSALMNPLTYVIVNCGIMALLWTGAVRVDAGILTQGQVLALVNYMSQILVELIKLANLIVSVTRALASARRVAGVLELKPSMADTAAPAADVPAGPAAVRFDQVSLTYAGAGAESLTGIDLTVAPGQTIGIIGGTGAGKSSLVNLIPRFYDATAGAVLVDGRDVRDWNAGQLRGFIGVVPQKAALFTGTIRDNLRWGSPEASDEELWQALDTAQASAFVSEKPEGLDTWLEQGGRNLSGGQRQRLTIARALVRRPRILILDDSASALDFATDAALRHAIRALDPMPTVFLVSQRAASLMHADQILVLEDGGVAGLGTHEALLETCPIYQEIYYSQFPREEALRHG